MTALTKLPPSRNVPPRATAMLESLRGLGYSTATAVADLIDNSVSAGASVVRVDFHWDGDASHVRILDNGHGMTDADLEQAMRLGARDPRDVRKSSDLGRFGMGLKTASFSQARRLTVASRTAGSGISCLRWDLDMLAQAGAAEWPLLEGASPGSKQLFSALSDMPHGTIVLWEVLDHIVTAGFTLDDMGVLIDEVEEHLAMVFHRMLDGSGPGFRLELNGRAVKPWDPYLLGHPAKGEESTVYTLPGGVRVQCHVLPHRDMLKTAQQTSAAGPAGWTSQQGFYIYRERRLLVAGGWLGLGEKGRHWTRDEPHRLARIRVDIPNSSDADWKINVLKSRASVPVLLRKDLTRLAAQTRDIARRVFANRGRIAGPGTGAVAGLPDLWSARVSTKGTSYRIERDHDLVRRLMDGSGGKADVEALLRMIEETLPVQRIWLDTAEERETPRNGFATVEIEEVLATLKTYYATLLRRGMDPDDARARLSRTLPFQDHPELIATLGAWAER